MSYIIHININELKVHPTNVCEIIRTNDYRHHFVCNKPRLI